MASVAMFSHKISHVMEQVKRSTVSWEPGHHGPVAVRDAAMVFHRECAISRGSQHPVELNVVVRMKARCAQAIGMQETAW